MSGTLDWWNPLSFPTCSVTRADFAFPAAVIFLGNCDSFGRRIRALVRAGSSELVGAHAVLPQGDPVLASLAFSFERAGRFAAI